MPDILYSFASSEDLEAIVRLLRECELPHEDIGQHLSGFIIAKHDRRLVGTIALEVYQKVGLLRSLVVAPEQRNRGLGRALYRRIVAYAHLRGVTALYLLTTTASEYFSRLGFHLLDRAQVPAAIGATKEFRSLCPSTAVCLAKEIQREARYYPSDVLRLEPDVKGATMWGVALAKAMLTYFEVEPHSRFDRHSHESEQITMVLEGELYFELDTDVVRVGSGEVLAVPSNVPHAVFTKQFPARAVDAWSPVMEKYRG